MSNVRLPKDDRYCSVRGYYVAICKKNIPAAMILGLLVNLKQNQSGLVSASTRDIQHYTHGAVYYQGILNAIKLLETMGYITVFKDKSSGSSAMYRVNYDQIQSAVDSIYENGGLESSIMGDTSVKKRTGRVSEIGQVASAVSEVGYPKTDRGVSENGQGGCPKPDRGVSENGYPSNKGELSIELYGRRETPVKLLQPVTVQPRSPPPLIEEKKLHEVEISPSSGIIPVKGKTLSDSFQLARSAVDTYCKTPVKSRREKGSSAQVMQKYGDRLKQIADEIGDEITQSMENYLLDEFWRTHQFPMTGFLKQYSRYLPGTEAKFPFPDGKEKSNGYTSQVKYEEVYAPISVYQSTDGDGAILRKREALDILLASESEKWLDCMRDIGHKITPDMYELIERWHDVAVREYQMKFGRGYPSISKPISISVSKARTEV